MSHQCHCYYPNINRGTYVPACVPVTVWHMMSRQSRCLRGEDAGHAGPCVMSRQSRAPRGKATALRAPRGKAASCRVRQSRV